jgi:hypothetical protein
VALLLPVDVARAHGRGDGGEFVPPAALQLPDLFGELDDLRDG